MTVMETLVASSIAVIVVVAGMQLYIQTNRSFAAQFNYVDLDGQSREALDRMSQQIRQASSLTNASGTNLVFVDADGGRLEFLYDPTARTLVRNKETNSSVLLKGCDTLRFSLFQRNPVGGNGDFLACTNPASCKLVQVTWNCSRDMLMLRVHSESMQTAKIMLRNKK
jgi:Tfp pilus assembly protein PilW